MERYENRGSQYQTAATRVKTAMMMRIASADVLPYDHVAHPLVILVPEKQTFRSTRCMTKIQLGSSLCAATNREIRIQVLQREIEQRHLWIAL